MISLIWAMDENRLIGNGNRLPWHIKEDLTYFKSITSNKIVLMGHETYMSLKSYYVNKPLPFDKVYVANLNEYQYNDATIIRDVIRFLTNINEDIFVVGGKIIYELSLPYADYLYITYVKGKYEGDVYFCEFDMSDFKLIKKEVTEQLEFSVYSRGRQ